jgi:hypothetical protein
MILDQAKLEPFIQRFSEGLSDEDYRELIHGLTDFVVMAKYETLQWMHIECSDRAADGQDLRLWQPADIVDQFNRSMDDEYDGEIRHILENMSSYPKSLNTLFKVVRREYAEEGAVYDLIKTRLGFAEAVAFADELNAKEGETSKYRHQVVPIDAKMKRSET